MGFMDFFSSSSSNKTSAKAGSKEERQISKNIAQQSNLSMPLFEQLVGQSRGQQGFNDQLFNQMQGQLQGFNQAFTPQQQGQTQAQQMQQMLGLGNMDQQLIQHATDLTSNYGQATPQQLASIQQATDLATQLGLSDLGRFRDDTLQNIAQNSASRGMRPTDTPIFQQSGQFGMEMNRQAEQLVRGLRQQQVQQTLEYPLRQGQFAMQQVGSASDLANRRQEFLANLGAENTQNQMNFGRGVAQQGLGIAQGASGAAALPALVSQRQFQSGKSQASQSPSGASIAKGFLSF